MHFFAYHWLKNPNIFLPLSGRPQEEKHVHSNSNAWERIRGTYVQVFIRGNSSKLKKKNFNTVIQFCHCYCVNMILHKECILKYILAYFHLKKIVQGLHSPWNSPGQNTGVGSLSLLQGIFPTQGSNPGLPQCRQILYQLSHQGSPTVLEWVAYPISSRSS